MLFFYLGIGLNSPKCLSLSEPSAAPPALAFQEPYLGTALPLTPPSAVHCACSLGPPSSAASGLTGCEGISGRGTSCVAQSLGRVHPQTEVPFGLSGFGSYGLSRMTCYIQTTGTTR